ncbi:host-nuclease inhibitor Gam family protein [Methylomonas rapida]|uniref:Host-nuclease inhibitor Gam family protein n=1 Tax=Methylomonas rapida TaxID=2963939 RepID=A0ABY7GLU2_9GAMM|nr:host-nuclease inhibitor Gam family protein [Methylomonas rapida]WAR43610.1 host-nuclease inhibitor Gam family protein [Methylomonas rapida]WAR45481.1 host-nuclease inhibitor Gam family protein [Methylomonas rapida]
MAKKHKAPAASFVCQSKEQTQIAIKLLGDTQRELIRIETEVNDEIAAITASRKDQIEALKSRVDSLVTGIQTWCEANRAELCKDGGKTANLITGEVSWRQRPPSVSIRAVDKVLETLKALKLERFIRTKEEPNKEAMLADPKTVQGIAGITINSGVEDFAVVPFEQEVA